MQLNIKTARDQVVSRWYTARIAHSRGHRVCPWHHVAWCFLSRSSVKRRGCTIVTSPTTFCPLPDLRRAAEWHVRARCACLRQPSASAEGHFCRCVYMYLLVLLPLYTRRNLQPKILYTNADFWHCCKTLPTFSYTADKAYN